MMKKLQFGKSKTSQFFSGKGFYIALALSLVAVGAAVFVAMNQTLGSLTDDDTTAKKNTNSANEWGFPQSEQYTNYLFTGAVLWSVWNFLKNVKCFHSIKGAVDELAGFIHDAA